MMEIRLVSDRLSLPDSEEYELCPMTCPALRISLSPADREQTLYSSKNDNDVFVFNMCGVN